MAFCRSNLAAACEFLALTGQAQPCISIIYIHTSFARDASPASEKTSLWTRACHRMYMMNTRNQDVVWTKPCKPLSLVFYLLCLLDQIKISDKDTSERFCSHGCGLLSENPKIRKFVSLPTTFCFSGCSYLPVTKYSRIM